MLIVPAYAKLNLGLAVVRRRPDGWHDIDSLVVPLDWHDLVGVALRPGRPGVTFRMSGETGGITAGPGNLAHRAATALAEMLPEGVGVDVWLDKRLPAGAGLGGGSSDAAAVLRAGLKLAPRVAGVPLDVERIRAAAGELGSDVPATLATWPVRVRGTGDLVRPAAVPPLWLAVATAGSSETPATYVALDRAEMGETDRIERLCEGAVAGVVDASLCGSALEGPAARVNPALGDALARLRTTGSERWHLTGSGGAAFCLTASAMAAEAAARRARDAGFPARACRSITTLHRTPGAE